MSYHSSAQRVRDPKFTLGYRAKALRSCVTALAFALPYDYHQLYQTLMPWGLEPPSEAALLDSLKKIEVMRDEHLRRLLWLREKRVIEKRQGNRYVKPADSAFMRDILLPKD